MRPWQLKARRCCDAKPSARRVLSLGRLLCSLFRISATRPGHAHASLSIFLAFCRLSIRLGHARYTLMFFASEHAGMDTSKCLGAATTAFRHTKTGTRLGAGNHPKEAWNAMRWDFLLSKRPTLAAMSLFPAPCHLHRRLAPCNSPL